MIKKDGTYVIMGLLDSNSIAYAIGQTIMDLGGKVIFTLQSERMKKIFFDRSKTIPQEEKDRLDIRFCDVTIDEEVKVLFENIGSINGVVHSIAFANPKTCLGAEFHTDAIDDIKIGFHISAVSLATVARYAAPHMEKGSGIVTLSFASQQAFPGYNWMGVNKAALEAVVRGLARRHGKDEIHVNAVSAGPVASKAAGSIPGFQELSDHWNNNSPIQWDKENDKQEVAHAVVFLVGHLSRKITGQTLYVDGGASIMGGALMEHERS